MICEVDDCNSQRVAKGFCMSHYHKMRRYGTPHGGKTILRVTDEGRECSTCRVFKSWDNFSKKSKTKHTRQPMCRSCNKHSQRKSKFGITPEEYNEMVVLQDGTCAICKEVEVSRDGRSLAVDHDHNTGEIRGLLCGRCNNGLGNFRDNPEYLSRAIEYLTIAGWKPQVIPDAETAAE